MITKIVAPTKVWNTCADIPSNSMIAPIVLKNATKPKKNTSVITHTAL